MDNQLPEVIREDKAKVEAANKAIDTAIANKETVPLNGKGTGDDELRSVAAQAVANIFKK